MKPPMTPKVQKRSPVSYPILYTIKTEREWKKMKKNKTFRMNKYTYIYVCIFLIFKTSDYKPLLMSNEPRDDRVIAEFALELSLSQSAT